MSRARPASPADSESQTDAPARKAPDEEEIVERIFTSIMEQQLPAGTKLSEAALCDAFGASRMRIRRVLVMLASREIVTLHSNRGAFVASPSPEEARSVFEARRTIEPNVIRLVTARASRPDLVALEDHVAREQKAQHDLDRREAIRLSGEFHVRLAAISGNSVLERLIKELVTRSSLIIGLFGARGFSNCAEHEHGDLIAAVRAGDGDRAADLMLEHLDHIERELALAPVTAGRVDVRRILGNEAGRPAASG